MFYVRKGYTCLVMIVLIRNVTLATKIVRRTDTLKEVLAIERTVIAPNLLQQLFRCTLHHLSDTRDETRTTCSKTTEIVRNNVM
ncbi:hypothetical protein C0J52_24008 [Blattella germanica]|nr:hypothetical protein C0J52_24008 [Blattella germanica]